MSTAPRRKLACRICTRRKVRCDKQIPCGNCVRRGTLGDCERDEPEDLSPHNDTATGRRFSEDAAATALTALRTRVAELEAALQDKNAGAEPAQSPAIATPQPQSPSPSVSPSQDSDIQDAVTVLEFLAWGRMKDPDRAMLSPEALKVSEHDDGSATSPAEELDAGVNPLMNVLSWLQILLPSQRQVYQLVQYHNECLLWFHGSYFASTFSRELALFYSDHHGRIGSDGVNLQWVALLFSIIAGTMTSAPAHETRKWGFDDSEARLLSQKWYKAVVTALNAANYTACHSIHSVQAVATLTNTAHMLGHSNTQSVLLASAVRIAQSLGLHRLDETASGQNSRHDAPLVSCDPKVRLYALMLKYISTLSQLYPVALTAYSYSINTYKRALAPEPTRGASRQLFCPLARRTHEEHPSSWKQGVACGKSCAFKTGSAPPFPKPTPSTLFTRRLSLQETAMKT